MKRKRQTFTVEGDTVFPLDMLRYDSCYPHTQTDVHTIVNQMDTAPQFKGEKVRVELERYVVGKDLPTAGRWESFGWKVLNVETF